jgi:pre-mRNA-splicing factor CWC22
VRVQIARGGKAAKAQLEKLGYEAVPETLNLIETGDQITHQVSLEESDGYNAQIALDVFKVDPDFQENEKQYEVGWRSLKDGIPSSSVHMWGNAFPKS